MLLPVAIVVAVIAVFASRGGSDKAGSGTLTIYSGQHEQIVVPIVAAFEKETGIDVSVRYDDEGVLAAQLVQEGDRSPADVFLAENSPALVDIEQRGLFAPVDAATIAATSGKHSSPTGVWVETSARVNEIVYNTDRLDTADLPKTVLELADPKWKGKLALAPTETDFQPIVTAVAARYGDDRAVEWLKGLKTNSAGHVYPDNEALVAQVNAGRATLGVINNYYWYRYRDEVGASKIHSAEGYLAPEDPGYVINIAGAGVLASSDHAEDAQRFLAFLVGKTAQELIATGESYEYPLGSGVVSKKLAVPYANLQPDPITIAQLGNGKHALELLRRAGLL